MKFLKKSNKNFKIDKLLLTENMPKSSKNWKKGRKLECCRMTNRNQQWHSINVWNQEVIQSEWKVVDHTEETKPI